MKILITQWLLFLSSVMIWTNLTAQQYPFVYYTPRDGLVNSRVRSITQDSKGRMYFITYGGISVYDGVKFKNYQQQDGLANELVNDIVEISSDSFLVATNAPLLNTLVRGRIGQYQTSDHFYPVINSFLKSNDGVLYVAADDGLYKLIDNKFIMLPVLDEQGINIGRNLARITEWKNYLLLIPWNFLQKEKLIIYDKEQQVVAQSITQKSVVSTAVAPNGELWMSSAEGIELLDLDSLQQGRITLSPLPYAEHVRERKNAHLYFDPTGDAWIYYNEEMMHLTTSGMSQIFSSQQGLNVSNLSDIFVDREGTTWMASDGNGVVKMPGTQVQILGDLLPQTKNNISAICQQSDTTWVFNITDNSFYRIVHDKFTSFSLGRKPFYPSAIYIVGETLYFIAGVTIYVVENKNLPSSYLHPEKIELDTPVIEIVTGLLGPGGTLIQAIRQDNTWFYLAVIHHNAVQMKQTLSYAVDQIVIDKDGYLWVPTRDNHLRVYSIHPESPTRYLQLKDEYSKEITGMEPRSITVDTSGNVWLGTRNKGVYRLPFTDKKLQSVHQLTTVQGLTDNYPYLLYCDPHNNIWAGSRTGLDKISLKNGEYIIENITKSKNLFTAISDIIKVTDDTLWVLSSNGDIISIADTPSGNIASVPALLLTSLIVNDREYDETATVFTHKQNNISISVAAPSFVDEKSIQYSYWLQGSSKSNWSKPSNNAYFNFINLPPGTYSLYVKAAFPSSSYPDQKLKYRFTIQPPYWQKWWFIAVIAICVVGLVGVLVRYYYDRKLEKQKIILEKKQAIEKERTRISTDMHDDLGAGLSRIKFLSDTIGIKQQQHLPVEDEIDHIRHHAHDMIDKMGEIVWALNEKNDSVSDLLSYTRAYAVEYLAENGLRSKIDKLPPLQPIMVNSEFRRNLYLSVKETLHNVIKHARANSVSMQFEVTDRLVIVIQDDGIGFDPERARAFGNGLYNIRKRMSAVGGEFQVFNDHGTRIVLTAPLPE